MRKIFLALIAITITGIVVASHAAAAYPGPKDPPTPQPDAPPVPLRGYTGLDNPAHGNYITRDNPDDPLAGFTRRPLDEYIIPAGGLFMDPLHAGPHYGIDYTTPGDYLQGKDTWVHSIGSGYVTARSACVPCFVDGDAQGCIRSKLPKYNFGFGGMVVVETPYSPNISIYVMYAHLNRDVVSLGDYVTADDLIGVVGNTGYSEEIHLHLEVRYGRPGQFWNADFGTQEVMDRWLATMYVTPAVLVLPDHHTAFVTHLAEWAALQPDIDDSLP